MGRLVAGGENLLFFCARKIVIRFDKQAIFTIVHPTHLNRGFSSTKIQTQGDNLVKKSILLATLLAFTLVACSRDNEKPKEEPGFLSSIQTNMIQI